MTTLTIETPRSMAPLLEPARYKGAHGGRGGTKSHFFAGLLVETALMRPGFRAVCVREVQRSLDQSVKRLIEDKIEAMGLGAHFRVLQSHIETPGDGRFIFQGMQSHTAESIKSLEGYDVCWVEEAHTMSAHSLELLRPTIRKEGSELWFSWNPNQPTDPVDALLRGDAIPPNSIVVETNWHDNPWLPDVLRDELEYDREHSPDRFNHIWQGGYRILTGALIFKNWRIGEPPDETPDDVIRMGADWGFTVDPSILIRCFARKRQLFITHEAFMIGCEVDHLPFLFGGTTDEELIALNQDGFDSLPAKLKGAPGVPGSRLWPIRADSAKPDTISYLQRHGFPNIKGAKKGPGSIDEGIERLQSYEIVIHPRCKRAIGEFGSYSYKIDKHTGDILPVPADKDNHYMDGGRYATEGLRGGQKAWGLV